MPCSVLSAISRGKTALVKTLKHFFEEEDVNKIDKIAVEQSLEKLERNLRATKLEMDGNKPRRSAKKKKNMPDPAKIGRLPYLGLVTDLGYVQDENDAFLLSWAAQSKMDATVVDDKRVANDLYHNKVKVWCTTDITKCKHKHRREAGKIDLPSVSYVPGNPEYLVNLIILDQQHENLRTTIFWKTFGNSLIFDTKDAADEFRAKLVESGREPSAIYTRDGHRIMNDGIMNPEPGIKDFTNLDSLLFFSYFPLSFLFSFCSLLMYRLSQVLL